MALPIPTEHSWTYHEAHLRIQRDAEASKARRIVGTASTATVDRQNSVVDQKSLHLAAERFLARHGKLFYMHNWHAPIGRVLDLDASPRKGELRFVGEIAEGIDIPVGGGAMGGGNVLMNSNNVWKMIEAGLLTSASIGFLGDEERGEKEGMPSTFRVKDLLEISLVTVPANADCEFSIQRALMFGTDLRAGASIRPNRFHHAETELDRILSRLERNREPECDLGRVKKEIEAWRAQMWASRWQRVERLVRAYGRS